ncbi:MAG: hypothetical protein KF850_28855 [Labilithrix sp.]|nr:hypothetical protein [Labilithrix sp.]
MRLALSLSAAFALLVGSAVVACGDGGEPAPDASNSSGGSSSSSGSNGSTPGGEDGCGGTDAGDAGAATDAGDAGDAGDEDVSVPAPAEVQLIGRWDRASPTKPRASWPGSQLVASFSGPNARIVVSSAAGGDGNETWLNVIVDGVAKPPVKVTGPNEEIVLATGLGAGTHTVVVEKRTEAKWGTITVEDIAFDGGQLVAPPPRKSRRIEFIAESTINGFGVEGDLATTCFDDDGAPFAPARFDNARKSMAFYASASLSAEHHLIAASAKGVVRNDDGTNVFMPALSARTLTNDAASSWDFSSWTPDVVVLSLGGTDLAGGATPPAGFQAGYDGLVGSIRTRHPNAHIYMTVWSQIKGVTRTALVSVLDAIKAARAGDTKLHVFSFTEATYPIDETGCYYHANDAHHQEAAPELVTAIRAATSWN